AADARGERIDRAADAASLGSHLTADVASLRAHLAADAAALGASGPAVNRSLAVGRCRLFVNRRWSVDSDLRHGFGPRRRAEAQSKEDAHCGSCAFHALVPPAPAGTVGLWCVRTSGSAHVPKNAALPPPLLD